MIFVDLSLLTEIFFNDQALLSTLCSMIRLPNFGCPGKLKESFYAQMTIEIVSPKTNYLITTVIASQTWCPSSGLWV